MEIMKTWTAPSPEGEEITYEIYDAQARSDISKMKNDIAGKQPAGSYLTEETDPTVPSWAKQPSKPTYTAAEVGALPNTTKIPAKTSDLTNDSGYLTAVPSEYVTETELTAKKYLTSVPSEYVTDSELTAKGYAKQSDVNSLSEEIADLSLGMGEDGRIYLLRNGVAQGNGIELPSGATGDVVGNIGEGNTIILSGALAEGTYTVKYEKEDGTTIDIGELVNADAPTFINQIPISQNADGTLFVGTNGEAGYKTGYRLSGSSGNESAQTGTEVTGFIPVTFNSTIYIKGITDDGTHVLGIYDSAHAKIITAALGNIGTFNGGVISFKMSDAVFSSATTTNFAFIRICANEITDESIITVNQPIE